MRARLCYAQPFTAHSVCTSLLSHHGMLHGYPGGFAASHPVNTASHAIRVVCQRRRRRYKKACDCSMRSKKGCINLATASTLSADGLLRGTLPQYRPITLPGRHDYTPTRRMFASRRLPPPSAIVYRGREHHRLSQRRTQNQIAMQWKVLPYSHQRAPHATEAWMRTGTAVHQQC